MYSETHMVYSRNELKRTFDNASEIPSIFDDNDCLAESPWARKSEH